MRPALAGFRNKVTEMTEQGLPLGAVERAIDGQRALTEDQKAALWLFAFSLRDRTGKRRQARALLAAVGEVPGAERADDRARPQEFDARGFPVPQRNPRFLERVARLLDPD
jgi:hypothetical protein